MSLMIDQASQLRSLVRERSESATASAAAGAGAASSAAHVPPRSTTTVRSAFTVTAIDRTPNWSGPAASITAIGRHRFAGQGSSASIATASTSTSSAASIPRCRSCRRPLSGVGDGAAATEHVSRAGGTRTRTLVAWDFKSHASTDSATAPGPADSHAAARQRNRTTCASSSPAR